MVARAEAPVWKPGDTWGYHGHTFDSKDNRFYERVVAHDADGGVYELEDNHSVVEYDEHTMRPIRARQKETGEVITGGLSLNPVWYPLTVSDHFSVSGKRHRQDEHEWQPYSETCQVVGYEDIEVHAGKFAAFRIDCEWNDGFAEHWYAPEVKNLVKMRWAGNRESFSAELWEYDLAK
jgi:hypothetical protein